MFPYTAEEAEWLSAQVDSPYWLRGQGDIAPITPANDSRSSADRAEVAPAA